MNKIKNKTAEMLVSGIQKKKNNNFNQGASNKINKMFYLFKVQYSIALWYRSV